MKIQPIDIVSLHEPVRTEPVKPVLKSRLKRLFDRQFRITSSEKLISGEPPQLPPPLYSKDEGTDQFEPSSVCLAKMVQNFIEESNYNDKAKCGRNRCNCFNGKGNESSDDEFDVFGTTEAINNGDVTDFLKSLIPCPNIAERNLLTETAMIVEKNKNVKRKDELRKIVTDHLQSLGYNSSICKSKWDKSPSFPAGEYEYIDCIMEEDRVLIDVDFQSEFEIARSTNAYKAVLQSVPFIFVGKSDRLAQIISVVSEAAKLSLKKKGMYLPPWRKQEYMRAKWLSPYTRASPSHGCAAVLPTADQSLPESEVGELDLIFGEKTSSPAEEFNSREKLGTPWQPPPPCAERPRNAKIVTGLTSLLKDKT